MHNFIPTDVGVFLLKMCKLSTFFHFAQFCINWCNCFNDVFKFFGDTFVRAFPSKISKNLAFSISKTYSIYFNISFYDMLNIKSFIFFTASLKYYFLFYFLFFILSLSLSLSQAVYLSLQNRAPSFFTLSHKFIMS